MSGAGFIGLTAPALLTGAPQKPHEGVLIFLAGPRLLSDYTLQSSRAVTGSIALDFFLPAILSRPIFGTNRQKTPLSTLTN